jgi:hypothetical protein
MLATIRDGGGCIEVELSVDRRRPGSVRYPELLRTFPPAPFTPSPVTCERPQAPCIQHAPAEAGSGRALARLATAGRAIQQLSLGEFVHLSWLSRHCR